MKRLPVVRSNQSSRDVTDSPLYLLEEAGEDIGLQFLDAVEKSYPLLSEQPGIGRVYVPENSNLKEFRSWRVHPVERYLVFYRLLEDSLEVGRVLHGTRDIWSVLGLEE